MDNNLLGITTLAQQSSKTPLVTGGKGQQLVGTNIDSFANNMSQSKLEGLSTVDYNNSKRSPFRSTNRNGLDESSDNISRAQSNYDQTTMFGSPGLNKSIDKNSKAKLQQLGSGNNQNNNQQQPNNMFSTFGSQSTSQPGQSAQRQSQHLNYASPDKANARSARKGSNAKSARSNSSREQSTDRHGSAARRGSTRLQHSASRGRSYSGTDQDSQERSFTYPCQAFKQFLLAVREGKIDMKDLNNSPFLIDYLTMQAQIGGGGSGGAGGDKGFANSLRSSTASNRSGSKSKRDNSKSNKKQRRASNLGDTLKAPKDSIIEEEEDDNMPMSTKNKPRQHNFNPAQNASANKRIPSPQKTQSPQKTLRQPAQTANGTGNNGQSNLAKHNFKEDNNNNNNNRTQNNQSPLKGQQQKQQQQQQQQQLPNSQTQQTQSKASPDKRQRRGRGERSTSGDERSNNGINTYNPTSAKKGGNRGDSSDAGQGVVDLRFDEKGRPIKNNNQYSTSNAKQQKSNSKNPNNNNNNNATDDDEYNTQNTVNNINNGDAENNNKGGKNRRGRRDRDSSVGGSSMDGSDNYNTTNNQLKQQQQQKNAGNNNNKHTLSPNEPRPLSKLPKPTERDDKPVRQSHNTMLPQIDEKLNTNGDGGEDGTFRDYQNPSSSRTGGNDGADTGRLIIFDKNTDFKTDNDYSLNALNDNQTKKYLKSKASPLKKSMFKEDEEDTNRLDDDGDCDGDGNNNNAFNDDANDDSNLSGNPLNTNGNNDNDSQQDGGQNSDGYSRQQQNYQDPVGSITMIQKKTPSRESRKVKSQMAMGGGPGSGSNLYQQQQQTPLVDNNNNNNPNGIQGLSSVIYNGSGSKTGGYKVDPSMGGDDLGMQSNHGGDSIKFKEFLDSQSKGSPIPGAGDRSRSNNLYNSQNSPLKDEDEVDNHQSNDRPMRREELDDTDLNDRATSSLAATLSRNPSNDKSGKQRRGRASRGGNQSSDQSMERQNPIEARHFESIGSRNKDQGNQLGHSQSLNNGQGSNKNNNNNSPNKSNSKSPSKSNRHNHQQQQDDGDEDQYNNDHQLTIEEHLDTYRSKTSSQMIIKSSRSFTSKHQQQQDDGDDYSDHDGDNYNNDDEEDDNNLNLYDGSKSKGDRSNNNQSSPIKSSKSRNNNNNDVSNKHFTQSYDNDDGNNNNNNNRSPSGTQTNKSRRTNNNGNSYSNSKNQDGNRTGTNKSNNSPSKKRYTNDNDDQDQDVYDQDRSYGNINSGRQESSRYQDDYNNHMNSNRKDNNGGDRRRENRRSQQNANSNYNHPNIKSNYNNNSNSDDNNNHNNYNNHDKSNRNDGSSRKNNNSNYNNNDNLMRQSQKSLTNLGNNPNYDEYNYSSFGQQQLNDDNYDPYNKQNNNNNSNSNNGYNTNQYSSSGKKQRRKRGSRERSNSNDLNSSNNNNNDQQLQQQQQQLRSSQIKNSLQPLRSSHANKYPTNFSNNGNDHQYKTNYSSNNNGYNQNNTNSNGDNEHQVKSKLEKYQSRLKELEDKLKQQVQANPTKPLDYRLIQEINDEAARTIQMRFRLKKLQKKQQEDAGKRHGNLVDRMVQTEPVNLFQLTMKIHHQTTNSNRTSTNPQAQTATNGGYTGSHDMDKFKRFFFAVFYTYMMMNTIMADVFKRQQPMQTQNQWNEEDYRNYINNRNNRNNNNNSNNNK